ncbi:MAG TPA: sulfotransferase, partial [Candidatus Acidoferrales bacterium]|nr:sulfotransferase [Candidatus Acidoferrales bacterium]
SLFETAAGLAPQFIEPIVHLANLAARQSDWDGAETLSNRALSIDPKNYAARACLVNIEIARSHFQRAEGLLRPLLAAKAPTPYDAAFVRGLLGDLRHAQQLYSQAFAAYASCNREQVELYRDRFDLPGVSASNYCKWLGSHFSRVTVTVERNDADKVISHVFLVGFPRSGTTLLENVLAANPIVEALEERDTLGDLTRRYLTDADGLARFHALTGAELEAARAAYWKRVQEYTDHLDGKCLLDKYPLNSMKLPLIAKLFPSAKILFAARDPRDVVLSCFRRMFNMNTSMFELLDLERAAHFYDAVMGLSMIYRKNLSLAWRDVRHETLVEDFERETRDICQFIGIPWDTGMLEFAERAKNRTIRTPSSTQVVRGLNSDSLGQWRNYNKQLDCVLPILEPWVKHWNYPTH